MSKLQNWVDASPERQRLFAQEKLIVDTTEEICAAMDGAKQSRAELASVLGVSKAYVSQVLCGSRNMTLRTLADIAHSLGKRPCVRLLDAHESDAWYQVDAVVLNRRPALFSEEIEGSNHPHYSSVMALPQSGVRVA